jgi:hypothetical protein
VGKSVDKRHRQLIDATYKIGVAAAFETAKHNGAASNAAWVYQDGRGSVAAQPEIGAHLRGQP